MKTKIIVYDFDGVICDSVKVKTEAFSELYSEHGIRIQEQVEKYHLEHGGISRFEKIKYFEEVLLLSPISENILQQKAFEFSKLVKDKVINSKYIEGARDFIESNSKDYLQYICTGTPEDEIIEILNKRGILHFFDGVYGAPKTKANILRQIIEETNLKVEDSIFIGDAMTDYKAAKELNMNFLGVKSDFIIFPENTLIINDFHDKILQHIIK